MKVLLLLMLMLGLIACSGSKSTNEADEMDTGVELADADEFSEDGGEFGDDFALEGDDLALDADAPMDSFGEESGALDQTSEMGADAFADAGTTAPVAMSGQEGSWTVSQGETLMIIAFKIYGDYGRWRDIKNMNSDKLAGSNTISSGMVLRYEAPAEPFIWNPEGNPYLIKVGDTLGKISTTTYGTNKFWKNIWDNNTPLIKDPNKIFAGFTIYTPVIEGRDVANN
ncbi:MAG: hypothetical protein CME62_16845 [Halobacteriovoraceae bacterium]|nr:hypothetical protein [Halobacteriovoraceae bacterium]|tara:strand:- start:11472 stop:12152 length:681 start_codon:yes stop_codon:yes gene_type:complete